MFKIKEVNVPNDAINDDVKKLMPKILELIKLLNVKTMKKIDITNKLILGNVRYWVNGDKLVFDVAPSKWNVVDINMDVSQKETEIYINQNVNLL
jgi:hypothetical protein